MSKIGLLVRIEAKPEYADKVEAMLRNAVELAREEDDTVNWYAFQEDKTTFGVFDTFENEEGRNGHLHGKIAAALVEAAGTMLSTSPDIRPVDLLAVKV